MEQEARQNLSSREVVVLAEDYDALVAWYVEVLGFRVASRFDDGYRYTNLENENGLRIGVAPASEAGVLPGERAKNTVLLQIEVPDVQAFFARLRASGTAILFGPSRDETGAFWFGGFADSEGNPIWVVDENCP